MEISLVASERTLCEQSLQNKMESPHFMFTGSAAADCSISAVTGKGEP